MEWRVGMCDEEEFDLKEVLIYVAKDWYCTKNA